MNVGLYYFISAVCQITRNEGIGESRGSTGDWRWTKVIQAVYLFIMKID